MDKKLPLSFLYASVLALTFFGAMQIRAMRFKHKTQIGCKLSGPSHDPEEII